MEFKINPTVYSNMLFSLPVGIVDEHIRMAGTMQLRVLLWVFRHAAELPVSSAYISKSLGIDEDEVTDAAAYWNEKGIILLDGTAPEAAPSGVTTSEPVAVTVAPTLEEPVSVSKVVEKITVNPPTHEEFVRRCSESKELRDMLVAIEMQLGCTLSFNMQSMLLMLHDDYGLPGEVIFLAVEYAKKRGKPTAKFIANIGRHWCENEIDTLEKATQYIEMMLSVDKSWNEFRDATGVKNPSPTKTQRDYLHAWLKTMNFSMDMVLLAYEEMADHTDKFSFQYMNKVLVNWEKENVRTPEDVGRVRKERSEKYAAKKKAEEAQKPEPSYDLDAFTRKAFQNPMDYFKKKKDGDN